MQPSQPQNLAVPIAIVVAGILIAGAVVLSNKGGGGTEGIEVVVGNTNTGNTLKSLAGVAGVNEKKFLECVASSKYNTRIDRDLNEGIEAGVRGTPFSLIVHKNGRIEEASGALPYANLKTIVDDVLANTAAKTGQKDYGAVSKLKADDHILGNPSADIILYEYSDFQCPFCKRFEPSVEQLMSEYGTGGKIAIVYRHFPLDQIHPQARPLAQASECATELGGNEAFWKLAKKVLATQGDFDLSTN